jgi:hypothetical protein
MAELREIKFSIRSSSASQLQLLLPQDYEHTLNKFTYTQQYSDDSLYSTSPVSVEQKDRVDLFSYWEWPAYSSKYVTDSITSDNYWAEEIVGVVSDTTFESQTLSRLKSELHENQKACYWDEKPYLSVSVNSDDYWRDC